MISFSFHIISFHFHIEMRKKKTRKMKEKISLFIFYAIFAYSSLFMKSEKCFFVPLISHFHVFIRKFHSIDRFLSSLSLITKSIFNFFLFLFLFTLSLDVCAPLRKSGAKLLSIFGYEEKFFLMLKKSGVMCHKI